MVDETYRLGIDFGTSSTVAALVGGDGRVRPLLFDSSPLLSSAVFVGADGTPLTGADAERAGLSYPAGLEPNPKRRIDDGTLWLGEREVGVVDLVSLVLRRVATEAYRVTGRAPGSVVLTHPAAWRQTRLASLGAAAAQAGLGAVRFVPEPVAAAAYFVRVLGHRLPADRCLVVYDFGAGTFDVSVVRQSGAGFEVVASAGLPDVGGLDVDAAVVAHARALTGGASAAWARLDWPQTPPDQQARHALWRGAKAAKEQLSRHPASDLHVPLAGTDVRLTREEFEKLATPLLDRTSALTLSVLREAAVAPEQVGGVFLVGGSSRIPLAATLLHRTLRIAPTALDYPELVVAEGSLHAIAPAAPVTPESAATVRLAPPAPAAPPVPPAPAAHGAPSGPPGGAAPGGAAPGAAPGVAAPAPPTARKGRRRALVLGGIATLLVVAIAATLFVLEPWKQGPITGATRVTTLKGHTAAVNAVQFSPDSTLLASAGEDKVVRFWDVEGRKKDPGYDLTDFTFGVDRIAFNADGTRLVSLSSTEVALWSVTNRQSPPIEIDTRTGLTRAGSVGLVGFSTDGDRLRTADGYGSVLLFDASTGKRVETHPNLAGPEEYVNAFALNPDGTTLAATTSKNGLRLYDVKSGKPITAQLKAGDATSFDTLRFSPDGKVLVAVTRSTNLVFFDVATGKALGDGEIEAHTDTIRTVAFSPDGEVLATSGEDNKIILWDVATQQEIGAPLKGHAAKTGDDADAVTTLAFSPDGKYLASGSTDKTVILWELTRG